MEITKQVLPHIEKAMGIKLYDNQKSYLLGGALTGGRASGKTLAYCVKLALSDGEPLNVHKPEEFSDRASVDYSRSYFIKEFMNIRGLLNLYKFKVRDVRR